MADGLGSYYEIHTVHGDVYDAPLSMRSKIIGALKNPEAYFVINTFFGWLHIYGSEIGQVLETTEEGRERQRERARVHMRQWESNDDEDWRG